MDKEKLKKLSNSALIDLYGQAVTGNRSLTQPNVSELHHELLERMGDSRTAQHGLTRLPPEIQDFHPQMSSLSRGSGSRFPTRGDEDYP